MTSFLLTLSLACPATLVSNKSPQRWDSFDQQMLVSSQNRCAIKYADSPCLSRFSKQAPRTHRAICGGTLDNVNAVTKN